MKRVAWLTDIHLNFVSPTQLSRLMKTIRQQTPDRVVISGDIGEAGRVVWYLKQLEQALKCPICFVLGNHDFYGGSFQTVERAIELLTQSSPRLHWLTRSGVIEIAPDVGMVGHESWSDGRYGDYQNSTVMLNDYLLIEDLAGLDAGQRLLKLNALGDQSAAYFREMLPKAFEQYARVFAVMHVPPFREACWYEGKLSNDESFLPHFSCKAVGDVLLEIMPQYPNKHLTVLCGHTHGQARVQMLDNLLVLVGGAEYETPIIQQIFEFED